MNTISEAAIQAVGDNLIIWVQTKLGTGLIANFVLGFLRKEWDTVGVADVAALFVKAGWTVTP